MELLKQEIAKRKKIGLEEVEIDKPFMEYGLDSKEIVLISGKMEKELHTELSPTLLLDYPTIRQLCSFFNEEQTRKKELQGNPVYKDDASTVSIIGISCKFPKIENVCEFLKVLECGKNCVEKITPERLTLIGKNDEEFYDEAVFNGGYLNGLDKFDYEYFGLSIQEALNTDPQQRLLLQEVVHALENANVSKQDLQEHKVGVFVGASNFDYLRNFIDDKADMNAIVGNSPAMLSNRISYIFNFNGPSMTIDTACSSSLVAVHEAVKSLMCQECDMAVVAGVNVILDLSINEGLAKANMLSDKGRCYTFDKRANGYVRGEGIGVVILQKESDALKQGNRIYANILGCSVNQDGRSASLTAPSKNMQVEVIEKAWLKTKLSKTDIEYVEAHGTGTELGDAIEIAALDEAYDCSSRQDESKLKVGAVKTNLGHLESAAGIAGLIKLTLSIYHNTLYPIVHLKEINPKLGLNYRKLEVVDKLVKWKGEKRIGAVSSFGFGGTNCHLILGKCMRETTLEESRKSGELTDMERIEEKNCRKYYFVPITAASSDALRNRLISYLNYLEHHTVPLDILENKLLYHTDWLTFRLCYVVESQKELLEKMKKSLASEFSEEKVKNHTIALLFNGQGTQWKGMAKGLFDFPKFRETFQKCRSLFIEMEHCDILEVLEEGDLQKTFYIQPLLFSIQVSLSEFLKEIGIKKKMVYGHSLGEVAAAYASGAISLGQAAKIIHYRSVIMDQFTGKGKMLSVSLTEEEANAMILREHVNLSVAVINDEEMVVVAGEKDDMEKFKRHLESRKIFHHFLPVDYAFHYSGLDPYMEILEKQLSGLKPMPSRVKFVSTVTGSVMKSGELNNSYWPKNMRNKVQFSKASKEVMEECSAVVEVGTATALLPYLTNVRSGRKIVSVQKRNSDCVRSLYEALAELFRWGVSIEWEVLVKKSPVNLELPLYVFDKKTCWKHIGLEKIEKKEVQENISVNSIQTFLLEFIQNNINSYIAISKTLTLDQVPLDSLRLFQLRSMIYERYRVKLELRDLQAHTSLEKISEYIYELSIRCEKKSDKDVHFKSKDAAILVTDNQKAIALDQWINKTSSKYNMSFFWKFEQELDRRLWEEAYQRVMNRHIALCTVYSYKDGCICQRKAEEANTLTTVKMSNQTEVKAYAHLEINQPFDLEEGVCRGFLIDDGKSGTYFLLVVHHIAIDGISIYLLLQQLVQAYFSLKNSGTCSSRVDDSYTRFQQKLFLEKRSDAYIEKVEYWKGMLKQTHFAGKFPLPSSNESMADEEIGELLFKVDRDSMVKLNRAANELKVSNFSILYSVYQLLYYKVTGDSDFITCTYFSGREQQEEMETIGYMVQPLYSKVKVEKNSTGSEYIRQMFEQLFTAYERNISISELNDLLEYEDGEQLNHVFVYEKAPVNEDQSLYILQEDTVIRFCGMKVKAIKNRLDVSQYDLVMMFEESKRDILGKIEYRKSAYSEDSVITLKEMFLHLLNEVVLEINKEICQYPLLSSKNEREVKLILKGDDSGQLEGMLFHDYLTRYSEVNPYQMAAVYGGMNICYEELDKKSNQLAHYILNRTQGSQIAIGVCMEKSIDFLIAIFGIMKSGCCYLPLDYRYPVQRLTYIIGDSNLEYIICDFFGRKVLSEIQQVELLDISQSEKEVKKEVDISISLDDIAYIIYTSGSTGKPKGVQVTHRGIENVVQEQKKLFQVDAEDKVCFFASISFDASVFEVLMGIGHGACLYFDKHDKMGASKILHNFLRSHGITIATLPASVLESMENENLQQLRVIITAGEPCSQMVKDRWAWNHRFYNAYGVTEATIWNSTEESAYGDKMNIGRSVSNTQLSIINQELHTCPVGVPGELVISGVGLSKGYIGLKELNSEKFYKDSCGIKFYRTGDLVRLGYNCKIEYMGRLDNQVKLRGFRIELEEIEEMLQSHESVSTVIVDIDRNTKLEQLIAFVKFRDADGSVDFGDGAQLKEYAAKYLPHYMVPNRIIPVQKWKLTVNGKIDRKAMIKELSKNREEGVNNIAEKSDQILDGHKMMVNSQNAESGIVSVEQVLCSYVSESTKIKVTVKDNLMQLGMNSIKGFEMISFIHEKYGVDVSFEQIMKSITLEEISDIIKENIYKESKEVFQSLDAVRSKSYISNKQRGIWLECSLNPVSTEYNIPIVLNIHGRLKVNTLCKSIDALVKTHSILRTRYVYEEDGIIGEIADKLKEYVEILDISHMNGQEKQEKLQSLIYQMQNIIFDISDVPLFKFLILTCNKTEHYLMLTIHHLISDGWSIKLILEQLGKTYQALENGEEFIQQVGDWTDGSTGISTKQEKEESFEPQREYWIKKIGNSSKIELMGLSHRPEANVHQGENIELTLNSALLNNINEFSKKYKASVFSLMLGAYAIVLRNYSGIEDITIGIPNLGRETKEERKMIGMFLDTLVAKITVHQELNIISYVQGIMQEILETYNHKVPYEQLSHWIYPNRQFGNQTLFQHMFNMINFELDVSSFANMSMDIVHNKDLNAKYDMTLYVIQQPGFIKLRLNYLSGLYTRAVMEQFIKDYEELLNIMTEIPEKSLKCCYSREKDIQALDKEMEVQNDFIEFMDNIWIQSTENSSREAIACSGRLLTYGDFIQGTNRIRDIFRKADIQKGDCLGIITSRTQDMITVVYQALCSNIAFLLIDNTLPLERVNRVIKSTGINVLIDLENQESKWRRLELAGKKKIFSDYRLLTSGTTGEPKCVIGKNEALSHFVKWEAEKFHLTSVDRFSCLSGISHDPIMRDILVPLYLQAILVIPEKPKLLDNNLYKYFSENQITVSHLTPTMAEVLLLHSGCGNKKLEKVKYLFMGGEPLTRDLVIRLLELCPNGEIVNYYGASETPQAMLYYIFNMQNIYSFGENLPLGRGIADVEGFVVNQDLSPCKAYAYGEILLKTPYLSKGYLNDSLETSNKFIENPYNKNTILYRTGDYGYKDDKGNIFFVARRDDEVKIRGNRLNLQEIQGIANEYQKVLSSCTLFFQDNLCLFLVAEEGFKIDEFKEWIKKQCPDYMVPKRILQIERIPVTENGKKDTRRLLQELEQYSQNAPEIMVKENKQEDIKINEKKSSNDRRLKEETKEGNLIQKDIRKIWSKILKTDYIRLTDKFFEVGGDSFKAVQLQYELKKYLKRDLDIVDIFNYPTIESFSKHMEDSVINDLNQMEDRAFKMKNALHKRNKRG